MSPSGVDFGVQLEMMWARDFFDHLPMDWRRLDFLFFSLVVSSIDPLSTATKSNGILHSAAGGGMSFDYSNSSSIILS